MVVVEKDVHVKAVSGAVEISVGEGIFLPAGDGENWQLVEINADAGEFPIAHMRGA